MRKRAYKKPRLYTLLFLSVLLLAVLFFTITTQPAVKAYEGSSFIAPAVLSEMTEEESVDFIAENGIEIPNDYVNDSGLGNFVLNIIQAVEANPDISFTFSYNVTLDFAESIKTLVNDYYGVTQVPLFTSFAAYILQDNWVMDGNGNWVSSGGAYDPNWENYNCYA